MDYRMSTLWNCKFTLEEILETVETEHPYILDIIMPIEQSDKIIDKVIYT